MFLMEKIIIYSFKTFFQKYLLSSYYVPGITLVIGDLYMNKIKCLTVTWGRQRVNRFKRTMFNDAKYY